MLLSTVTITVPMIYSPIIGYVMTGFVLLMGIRVILGLWDKVKP